MALAGLLRASLLDKYVPQFEQQGITIEGLRSISEDDSKEIEEIAKRVGMTKAEAKKLKKIHEKLHLQIHSFHLKPAVAVSTRGPYRIVLVGKVGSAKTSVFNALTGLTNDTGAGRDSVTRTSVEALSICGNLLIVDTPGLGATSDKAVHAHALRAALSSQNATHAVIFVTEMTDRVENARKDIDLHYGILRPFHNNLVVLFTKVDQRAEGMDLETVQDARGKFDRDSNAFKTKQGYIGEVDKLHEAAGYCFYHHGAPAGWLRNQIQNACTRLEPMRHDFSDFEFAWHFDTAKEWTAEERRKINKLKDDFQQLCEAVLSKVRAINWSAAEWQGPAKQVFLSDLVVKLTCVAEDFVNDYHKIVEDEVTPEIFADYLHTKKEIAQPLKVITEELQRLNQDSLSLTSSNYRVCPHCGQVWYKEPQAKKGSYGGRMGCDGSTTCGSRMGRLDIPDNGGLRFQFSVTADRRDMNWSRGTFGVQSSLDYIMTAMQSTQTQVNVDISNASRSLRALDGMYINKSDGSFSKAYTHYLQSNENPVMMLRDGFWQLFLRPGGDWCMRQPGEAPIPPGGQWEIAPRFMQATSDSTPQPGSEWIAVLDGAEHRVRVIEARTWVMHSGWRRLNGYSLMDGTTFDENSAPQFKSPAVSCHVKVTKAVGCGKNITWSQMAHADPEVVGRLGLVDSLEETGCALQAVGMELRGDLLESRAPSSVGDLPPLEDYIDDGMSVLEL